MNIIDLKDIIKILSDLEDRIRDIADIISIQKKKIVEVINFFGPNNALVPKPLNGSEKDIPVEKNLSISSDKITNQSTEESEDKLNEVRKKTHRRLPRTSMEEWMRKIYPILIKNPLTADQLFIRMIDQKKIIFKNSDEKKRRKSNLIKILRRLRKNGFVTQVSNQYGAAWEWIGGAVI